MPGVIAHAPAKINLLLAVEPRVVDGKHPLESVFCTLALADTILFDFVDGQRPFVFELQVQSLLDANEPPLAAADNSMTQTLRQFAQVYGLEMLPSGRLEARLHKSIPTQAGLGGGSSDAAAMLRMLCWLAQIDPLAPPSLKVARQVGADVPFFLHAAKAGSCALMDGFGDQLVQMLPKPSLDILLVKPAEGVSTPAAYSAFDADPLPAQDSATLRQALADAAVAGQEFLPDTTAGTPAQANAKTNPCLSDINNSNIAPQNSLAPEHIEAIATACANNLEPAAITLLPQIAQLKSELLSQPGVLTAMLCGSGSCVFAICANSAAAQAALKHFSQPGLWAVATKT
jgi:4-diphosphocytidyl-2-C-methyl-D-erythritol kinase